MNSNLRDEDGVNRVFDWIASTINSPFYDGTPGWRRKNALEGIKKALWRAYYLPAGQQEEGIELAVQFGYITASEAAWIAE